MPNWFWSYSLINLKMKRGKKGSWWIKNTTSIPPVYHQYTTSIPQRPLQVWIRDFVFTRWCNETFFSISVSRLLCIALHCVALHCTALHCIALHCSVWSAFKFKADSTEVYESSMNPFFLVFSLKVALHCIALRCSVWSAFQFKADSTEIYESSMNLFLLVFSLKCISSKTRQHWDLREFCFCFSACNAFQFVTTVCTS